MLRKKKKRFNIFEDVTVEEIFTWNGFNWNNIFDFFITINSIVTQNGEKIEE